MMPRQKSAAAAADNAWVPGNTRNPEAYTLKDQV